MGQLVYHCSKRIDPVGIFQINVIDLGRSVTGQLVGHNQKLRFQLFASDSSETYSYELTYAAFDALFRFNADLMNPNRRSERYFWVCQRLDVPLSDSSTRSACLAQDPTSHSPSVQLLDRSHSIPMGRLTAYERSQLREGLRGLEGARQAKIAEKAAAAHEAFLRRVFAEKSERAALAVQSAEEQQKEHEKRIAERTARTAAQSELAQRNNQLALIRKDKIEKIQISRRQTSKQLILAFLSRAKIDAIDRSASLTQWKSARRGQVNMHRLKILETRAKLAPLEEARLVGARKLDENWVKAKVAWLSKEQARTEKEKKKAAVLKEKKQAALHEWRSKQKKIYDDLALQRKERATVQLFCSLPVRVLALADSIPAGKLINGSHLDGLLEKGRKIEGLEHIDDKDIANILAPRHGSHGPPPAIIRKENINAKDKARDLKEAELKQEQRKKDEEKIRQTLVALQTASRAESALKEEARVNEERQLKEKKRLAALRESNIQRRAMSSLTLFVAQCAN